MSTIEQRRHFRIKYQDSFRPELIIDGKKYQVMDVSVSGIRLLWEGICNLTVGEEISISIVFKTKAMHSTRAQVVKIANGEIMLSFRNMIHQDILKNEAETLLEAYGEVQTDEY